MVTFIALDSIDYVTGRPSGQVVVNLAHVIAVQPMRITDHRTGERVEGTAWYLARPIDVHPDTVDQSDPARTRIVTSMDSTTLVSRLFNAGQVIG